MHRQFPLLERGILVGAGRWVFPPGLSKNHRSGWVGFQPEQINQKLQLANMTLLNSVLSLVKFSAIHS